MKKIITVLLLLISLPLMSIDLDTALSLAKENNIQLKREGLKLDEKRRSKDTAYNVFFPKINGMGTYSRKNSDPNMESFTVGYSASLDFTPALFNGITVLIKDYELGQIGYAKVIKSINSNVKEIFYNIILIKEQISLLEDNLKTTKERYEQMKKNYEAGLVSEYELLKVQVSYENFKPELNSVRNTYNSILLNFKTLLGIPLEKEITIEGTIEPTINNITVDEAYNLALVNNSDIQIMDKYEELFDFQKKSTFSFNFLPIIRFSYGQSSTLIDPFGSDFNLNNFGDDTGSFSITASYPIHNLFPNSSARLDLENIDRSITDIKLQKKALIDGLKMEISNYISILDNSVRIQEGLELTVMLAQKSLSQVKQAYWAGTAQLIDVESAENEYKKSRLELLKEKYNYTHNLISLETIISPQ